VADFYRSNTLQILVGYSAGGGYDTYARTLSRHIGRHIPGNPNVVVRNVPGAGSMVLTNQIANTLPQDGTVFGTVARGIAFEPLFGNEQAQFDAQSMNWLGSLNNEAGLCAAWHTSRVSSWEDLLTETLVVGGTGAGADTDTFPRVLAEVMGFGFQVVSGYPGSNDVNLAMERGEVQGHCSGGWSGVKPAWAPWIEQGLLTPLFQLSLNSHPELEGVPLITDLAETPEQAQILNLLFARQVMGRPFVAPPNVPAERLDALRAALAATVQDPDFLADAANQGLEINFVTGADIQAAIATSSEASPELVNLIVEAAQ
jgi:tripartite-type tricarboxylate transporter receptor subunit TctC